MINERDIVTLPVIARDNHGYTYSVVLERGPLGIILRILNTPGSWYLDDLRKRANSPTISIDFGQKWNCVNFDKIMSCAMEVV